MPTANFGDVETVTNTTATCGSPSVTLGNSVQCSAVVVGSSPSGIVSWSQAGAGNVTFSSDSCTLSYTQCQVEITGEVVGQVVLNATYGGDPNNLPSSATVTVTVSSVTFTCNSTSVPVGKSTTCTAEVAGSITPTGNIAFTQEGPGNVAFSSSVCTLSSGACQVNATGASTGNVALIADYSGDSNNRASSGSIQLTVQAISSTSVICATPTTVGTPSICTASVAGSSPEGPVYFSASGQGVFSSGGVCWLSSGSCSVTYTPRSTSGSPQTINATYEGDVYNTASLGTTNVAVEKSASVTSVVCAGPVTVGTSSTCTATIAGFNPSGTVSFLASGAGSFDYVSCALAYGACNVNYVPSGVEGSPQTINASYSGDLNNLPSNGTTSLAVNPVLPGTSVTCGYSTVLLGSSIVCTATVTGLSPTGTVSWSKAGGGNATISPLSCMLSAIYQCQVSVTGVSPGQFILNGSYSGDLNNLPSSGTFTLLVYSVKVTCTPRNVVMGHQVSCKAIVVGSPTPTGKLTWSSSGSGKFSSSTCRLLRGSCTVRYSPYNGLSPVTVTASYPGDSNNLASSGNFTLLVTKATSKTTLACISSVLVGRTVRCQVTVTGYKPIGNVTWSWASSNGGSVAFSSSSCTLVKGRCFILLTAWASGQITIQANYTGDTSNNVSLRTRILTIR